MGFRKFFKRKEKSSGNGETPGSSQLKTQATVPSSSIGDTQVRTNGDPLQHDGLRPPTQQSEPQGQLSPSQFPPSEQNNETIIPPPKPASKPSSRRGSLSAMFGKNTDDENSMATANGNGKALRKKSLSMLRKASFNHDTDLSFTQNSISSMKDLPEELLPVVTLINHQQSRCYYKGNSFFYDPSKQHPSATADPSSFNWSLAYLELNGNDITVDLQDSQPIVINICDCELSYNKPQLMVTLTVTNSSIVHFHFASMEELNSFYSSLLLCKFEYQQLQEAYTGALLSSQAIHFSDIKTLLSPNNKTIKEEWCVIRFPFLNDKWIRCLLVVKPNNKIEIYTNSKKSKKHLLSTINNGLSSYTIYPNDPVQIQNNSLLRLYAHCYINSDLLNVILNDDTISSITNENLSIRSKKNSFSTSRSRSGSRAGSRTGSRTNSLTKRLSVHSLKSSKSHDSNLSDCNSNFSHALNNQHKRISSIDTTISDPSFINSKTPKKLSKKAIVKSHLIYIIPESHASVKPCEIMLRLMIPILNSFSLYGRPHRFISSRTDKNSLLFGLPQLPNIYYLNNKSSLDLINLNIDNAIRENWMSDDWNSIFKELMAVLMDKGWKGGAYEGDLAHLNVSLNMDRHYANDSNPDYDPMEDFIDRASSANRSISMSTSITNEA